jgi:hypothetical protein
VYAKMQGMSPDLPIAPLSRPTKQRHTIRASCFLS